VNGLKGIRKPIESKSSLLKKSASDYGASENQNQMIGVPALHKLGYSGQNVRIALFDTGFLTTHEVFDQIRIVDQYDFIQNDRWVANDDEEIITQHNHGTMVLAVIGGYQPGKLIGPAYSSEYILAKTEDISSETHVEEDNWVAAAEWVDSVGVDIISSSLGYSVFDEGEGDYTYQDMDGNTTIITRAADKAVDRGIAVFTSAGNEGTQKWYYITAPADGKNVITMGGARPDGSHWPTSSRGPTADGRIKPDLIAQGQSVMSIVPGSIDLYGSGSGTSFSSPLGAGAGALLLSVDPTLSPMKLRDIMRTTASQADNPDNNMGYGIIDLEKALLIVKNEFMIKVNTFTVKAQQGSNEISWQSDIQISNDSWSIARKNPSGEQVEIARIKGEEFNLNLKKYTYLDHKIEANTEYEYYLSARSNSGNTMVLDSAAINSAAVQALKIITSFPNPFNNSINISFSLNTTSPVNLQIYDINGRRIRNLLDNEIRAADFYNISWNGRNDFGNTVSSGTYFVVLQSGQEQTQSKILFLK
jgi:subtilisin family serine protease